jgi:hypothetical protein
LAFSLARVVQEHPELTQLIDAWPSLAPELRAAFLKMVKQ